MTGTEMDLKPPPARPSLAELEEAGLKPPPVPQVQVSETTSAESVSGDAPSPSKLEVTCPTCSKGRACGLIVKSTQEMKLGMTAGNAASAARIMQSLRAGGHRPSTRTYTTFLTTLSCARRNEDAEKALYVEMAADEVTPDEPCYNAVAHAWCKAKKPERAQQVVERMIADGVAPSVNTFGPIVSVYGEEGRLDLAEKVLAKMEAVGVWPKEKTYNGLVKGLCRAGLLADARLVIDRMLNDSLHMERVSARRGTVRPSAVTFGLLIDAYCRAEKMGEARKLLAKMKWEAVRPTIAIFNMLIRGYALQGNTGGAENVLREVEGGGEWDCEALNIYPDKVTFTTLMNMWADNPNDNSIVKVRNLQKKMVAAALPLDDVMYGTLIKAYLRARRPQDAEAVLQEMGEAGATPGVVAWTSVIAAWVNAADMQEAYRVLEQMQAAKCRPNHMTFHHLIFGWGKCGDPVAALGVIEAMKEARVQPNPTTYTLIKEAYTADQLDPPPHVLAEAALVNTVSAQEKQKAQRKRMKARGKDGRLLTTIAAETESLRRERQQREAEREASAEWDGDGLDDVATGSFSEYWEQEWEMFLDTASFDDGRGGKGGRVGGRGGRRGRGGSSAAALRDGGWGTAAVLHPARTCLGGRFVGVCLAPTHRALAPTSPVRSLASRFTSRPMAAGVRTVAMVVH